MKKQLDREKLIMKREIDEEQKRLKQENVRMQLDFEKKKHGMQVQQTKTDDNRDEIKKLQEKIDNLEYRLNLTKNQVDAVAEDIEHGGQQKPKFTSKFNQASEEEKNYLQIYNEEQAKKALEPKKKVEASETYKKLSKERLD